MLALVASSLQLWLSQSPAWVLFKVSAAAVLCSSMLTVVVLGKEFGWWWLDGEVLDKLALAWLGVTLIVAGLTYWLIR